MNDTIAAIATSAGEAGIGIVRISGKDALSIADKVFISPCAAKPSSFDSHTVHYGWVGKSKDQIIDEILLTVMLSPRTYTREDVVEINCHGGLVALRAVLDLVLACGCRMAEPGEFTKRAFLNGRIDLSQAEAVLDIIRAKTDKALENGLAQLKGSLSRQISAIRRSLLEALALLEASLDFPEENDTLQDLGRIKQYLLKAKNQCAQLLEQAQRGKVLREGINTVICGRPNVGKSSLLNALLRQERSIVTPLAGTTRDAIEEIIDIKGLPVKIMDTAGLLEPRDIIEKKAVAKTKMCIRQADLVLVVFDAGKTLQPQDRRLIRSFKSKKAIAVINKVDKPIKIQREIIQEAFSCVVEISAKCSRNINGLENAIVSLVCAGQVDFKEAVFINLSRHLQKLRSSQKLIAKSLTSIDNKISLEYAACDIKGALGIYDQMLGKSFSQDMLDKIFGEFCIGK